MKPSTSEVEMDLSIDVDSNNWDSEKASRLSMPQQVIIIVAYVNLETRFSLCIV